MSETIKLRSYLGGRWIEPSGKTQQLVNPATGETMAEAGSSGVDFAAAAAHARTVGGPALREMTFAQRGKLVTQMYQLLHKHRDQLMPEAMQNGGCTRGDAKFDIDGAWGTLAFYGKLGEELGEVRHLLDGEAIQLTRSARFFGQHLLTPKTGVAVHVNAFNFPAWGFAEKAACALLAGMPVITKPATSTALTTYRMIELLVEAKVLPDGALSFIAGSVGDLLDHLGGDDVLSFTGSADTAAKLRGHACVVERSTRINVEADSLNAAILCPDVERGSPAWDLFVGDVIREMTQKTGQKCTAVRRILVPSALLADVSEALVERLSSVKVGDPMLEEVGMGPVATAQQHRDVLAGIARLRAEAAPLFGGDGAVTPVGAGTGKGFFVSPVLLRCDAPDAATSVHTVEVFGPVATLMAYDGEPQTAARLFARGGGTLVASVYGDDRDLLARTTLALAPHTGRILLGSSKLSGQSTSPGMVLPSLVHGGPGRAGGGEELGGRRGVSFYLQRTAIQADKPILEQLAK